MIVQGVSISAMLNQSIVVLTKPSVQSFEQFERAGGQREGMIYVAVAAAISGIAGFIGGIWGGPLSMIGLGVMGAITPLALYYVFSYVLNWIGKQQGSTGSQNEIFYTVALYTAPLMAIWGIVSGLVGLIQLLACVAWIIPFAIFFYQAYLSYLTAQSSMNLDTNKALTSAAVAFVAETVVWVILNSITTMMR